MLLKYLSSLRNEKLVFVVTISCIIGTVLLCILALYFFDITQPAYLVVLGVLGAILSAAPNAYGYCYLRDNLEKKEIELKNVSEKLKAALINAKELGALLPMCISCKKIRSDKGYWDRMENYVISHSKASFTHGICPECLQEFMAKEMSKKESHHEDR